MNLGWEVEVEVELEVGVEVEVWGGASPGTICHLRRETH